MMNSFFEIVNFVSPIPFRVIKQLPFMCVLFYVSLTFLEVLRFFLMFCVSKNLCLCVDRLPQDTNHWYHS